MSKDDGQQGSSPSDRSRTASTAKLRDTEKNTDGSPEAGSEDSPITITQPDFAKEFVRRLGSMTAPMRMAKVLVQKPTESEPVVHAYMVLRDDIRADRYECIRFYRVTAFSTDKTEMYQYKTHEAIGIPVEIPVRWIKGFQWTTAQAEEQFFDIHQFKDPN